ncbi:uncharacterized protein LOC127096532 [Lathyrus oleraceus]|uniref:uncharacterized protein LOC127096532 n=1 Tax=Pisum sativum TaxID=3888 RepID=UPI0021D2C4D9|nr:uncharacterized protein LOC127096532 [Pisum sativum]
MLADSSSLSESHQVAERLFYVSLERVVALQIKVLGSVWDKCRNGGGVIQNCNDELVQLLLLGGLGMSNFEIGGFYGIELRGLEGLKRENLGCYKVVSEQKMVGSNDAAIVVALQAVAQAVQNQPNVGWNDEFHHLGKFQRNNPPTSKGMYHPDGAHNWLREIEWIFRVMNCSEAQKVRFGIHMLVEEVDDWWINTRQVLDVATEVVTWAVFNKDFLRSYFPEDVHGKKEIDEVTAEFSKCIKFENGLHTEIKQAIGYQRIRRFPELVNNCRIYEDDSKARSTYYKGLSERRGNLNLNHGKPYNAITDKGKQKVIDGKRPSRGGAPTPLKCYRCGDLGHCVSECKSDVKKCYKCRNSGYLVADCKENMVTGYNYGEPGHISTRCSKPKQASTRGKVFVLTGTQTSSDDRLIRGICYINNTPFIDIIDTSATRSFIVADCVKSLGLVVSSMSG